LDAHARKQTGGDTVTSANEPDLERLLQSARQLKEGLAAAQQDWPKMSVEGVAAGGAVRATLGGTGEIQHLEISPHVIDPDRSYDLANMIVSAIQDAQDSLKSMHEERFRPLTERFGRGTS
jgi:DNA-binding protein YbaB